MHTSSHKHLTPLSLSHTHTPKSSKKIDKKDCPTLFQPGFCSSQCWNSLSMKEREVKEREGRGGMPWGSPA